MTAFVPISSAGARQILKGISEVDEGLFLSAFVEAGPVRAYAAVIETLSAGGGRTEVRDGRIPPMLWRRIVAEGKLQQVLASGSVRLDGDGLVGGRPAVMITGVRFNEANVRHVANQHGPTPPPVAAFPVAASAKPSVKAAAPKPTPSPIVADAPPLITMLVPAAPAPTEAKRGPVRSDKKENIRRGLPDDAITVSIAEACEILGVGRTKLNELMKSDLQIKRIGRSVKIIAQSIRDYLARK